MKLRINGFENEIKLNNESINILQISNPQCFTHIIEIINQKINGIETNEIFLLDEQEKDLNLNKESYLIFDLYNIEYNTKKILNKIYEIISNNIENAQELEIEKLSLKIRNYIIQEINELPFEFIMKRELSIQEILKLYDLKIDSANYTSILERLEILIDLLATLKIAKILIIPNLKTYLSDKELLELYKYSLYNNINLLIIERENKKKLTYENILVIDEEFDERIN